MFKRWHIQKGGAMRKFFIILSAAIFVAALPVKGADACTSVRIKTSDGKVFYARTMEGEVSPESAIAVIPRGTEYAGTLPDASNGGLKWRARYGVVGMNALGLPYLSDGMNEKGLSAGNLLFPGFAKYQTFEAAKAHETISNFEVLTWILTNFENVDEVKRAIEKVRVVDGSKRLGGELPLHFVIHDRFGKSIVIEYAGGERKVYDNPIGVFTNSPTFDWHMINLRNYINLSAVNIPELKLSGTELKGLGQGSGMLGLPGDFTPPSRFIRMTALSQAALPVKGADAGLNLAMTIINNVDIPEGAVVDFENGKKLFDKTWWTVVADQSRLRYYYRTYTNKNWRYVDVAKALAGAKEFKNVPLETSPDYQEVSEIFSR